MWRAIQKRSHKSMYKNDTIAKLESNILVELKKLIRIFEAPIIFLPAVQHTSGHIWYDAATSISCLPPTIKLQIYILSSSLVRRSQ